MVLRAEEPRACLWYCHVPSHVTAPKDVDGQPTVAGMVGIVQVGDGETILVDPEEDEHH